MGRVAGAYGVRGWLRVAVFSERPEALAAYGIWRVGGEKRRVTETRAHSGALLARLVGIDDREAANGLKGAMVEVERGHLPEPGPGEFYWSDLLGARVVNGQGVDLGELSEFRSNGAHELIRVKSDRERWIPWVHRYVTDVDLENGRVLVDWEAEW